jgi:hypothetical protein
MLIIDIRSMLVIDILSMLIIDPVVYADDMVL